MLKSHSRPLLLFVGLQMDDGAEFTQSLAMLRYAGKIGGLYPKDELTALKVGVHVMWCWVCDFTPSAPSAVPNVALPPSLPLELVADLLVCCCWSG